MAKCAYCNSMILFGGVTDKDLRFCNAGCQEKGQLVRLSKRLPMSAVREVLDEVHQGRCPQCKGKGPVDVHVKHTVWSAVYLTSWRSSPMICCRSCGRRAQLGGIAFCMFLGWWGFPYGLVMTPVQIVRNFMGLTGGPDPDEPSAELQNIVRLGIAAGDFGPVGRGSRSRASEDVDYLEDAFESDEADDDFDDVEVVTKSSPKRRPPKSRSVEKEVPDERPRASARKTSSDDAVSCPSCDASFRATPAVRGKRVKCPKCKGVIEVPE